MRTHRASGSRRATPIPSPRPDGGPDLSCAESRKLLKICILTRIALDAVRNHGVTRLGPRAVARRQGMDRVAGEREAGIRRVARHARNFVYSIETQLQYHSSGIQSSMGWTLMEFGIRNAAHPPGSRDGCPMGLRPLGYARTSKQSLLVPAKPERRSRMGRASRVPSGRVEKL
jgi:hypothetical protein